MLVKFPKLESIEVNLFRSNEQYYPYLEEDYYKKLKKIIFTKINLETEMYSKIVPFLDMCSNLEEIYIHTALHITFLLHLVKTKTKLRRIFFQVDNSLPVYYNITDNVISALKASSNTLRYLELDYLNPPEVWPVLVNITDPLKSDRFIMISESLSTNF